MTYKVIRLHNYDKKSWWGKRDKITKGLKGHRSQNYDNLNYDIES